MTKTIRYVALAKIALGAVAAAVAAGLLPTDNSVIAALLALYGFISGSNNLANRH